MCIRDRTKSSNEGPELRASVKTVFLLLVLGLSSASDSVARLLERVSVGEGRVHTVKDLDTTRVLCTLSAIID